MKKLVLIFSILSLPLMSQAQDAFYVSGLLGLTSPNYSDSDLETDTELSYGARAGLLFNENVSAGIYLQRYAGSDPDFTVGETDVSLTNIMAEVTYYANMADENTFWISGLLGVTQSSTEFSSGLVADNDESDTAFGFAAGYHFMVAPNFSLSPQITYIYTDTDTSSYSEISGLANLTIWL